MPVFFQALNAPKLVFSPGPDGLHGWAWRAHWESSPRSPIVRWGGATVTDTPSVCGGGPPPHTVPFFDAFGTGSRCRRLDSYKRHPNKIPAAWQFALLVSEWQWPANALICSIDFLASLPVCQSRCDSAYLSQCAQWAGHRTTNDSSQWASTCPRTAHARSQNFRSGMLPARWMVLNTMTDCLFDRSSTIWNWSRAPCIATHQPEVNWNKQWRHTFMLSAAPAQLHWSCRGMFNQRIKPTWV